MQLTAEIIHGFSSSLLQRNFDTPVESPACHLEWWELCCSKHPQVAIAAPRRHAKSTAITLAYTLACVVFRERRYVLIVSDTVTQAVQFLHDIKKELMDNEQLRSLFKIKEFTKDSEDDVICQCEDGHTFRIQAKGAEQKLRGLKWNNLRPDLVVCDDLENDEIVMNKERREKFRRWFYGALLPCMSVNGRIRYVGTILHSDSMLESLMPKPYHKDSIVTELKISHKEFGKNRPWKAVKYKSHNEDYSQLLWSEHYTKSWFVNKRQEYVDLGIPDVYSMEFLNVPIDESLAYFKRPDFLATTQEDELKNVRYYITGDLAISERDTADYTVFVVSAVDEDRRIYIKDVIRERMDGMEIVETILGLERVYQPEAIGIEKMQVSQAIGPFLREEMIRTNTFPSLIQLEHRGKDKIARAKSIQGRMRAHTVKFDKSADWYQDFEDECASFPRSKHDDQVDAFAYLGMLLDKVIEAPTKEEEEEELYQDELRESGHGDAGKSSWTGY